MSEWQDIETAPIGSAILVYNAKFPAGVVSAVPVVAQKRIRTMFGGGPMEVLWVAFSDGAHAIHAPTHWMPLPALPMQATEAGTAETGTGSVHEGAVGNADAPEPCQEQNG